MTNKRCSCTKTSSSDRDSPTCGVQGPCSEVLEVTASMNPRSSETSGKNNRKFLNKMKQLSALPTTTKVSASLWKDQLKRKLFDCTSAVGHGDF